MSPTAGGSPYFGNALLSALTELQDHRLGYSAARAEGVVLGARVNEYTLTMSVNERALLGDILKHAVESGIWGWADADLRALRAKLEVDHG